MNRTRRTLLWVGGCIIAVLVIAIGALVLFFPAERYERIEDPSERKRDLLGRIEHGWADFLGELIEVSEPERIAQVGIWDRDPVAHWTAGRVALLGDAAHHRGGRVVPAICRW